MKQNETKWTIILQVPSECPGVPSEILQPANQWAVTGVDETDFMGTLTRLGCMFNENFKNFRYHSHRFAGNPFFNDWNTINIITLTTYSFTEYYVVRRDQFLPGRCPAR
jgi:hypothetical protein